MCNLSQGIKEQAYAEGTENGIAKGVAKMLRVEKNLEDK